MVIIVVFKMATCDKREIDYVSRQLRLDMPDSTLRRIAEREKAIDITSRTPFLFCGVLCRGGVEASQCLTYLTGA
jgi:hypothetical protein